MRVPHSVPARTAVLSGAAFVAVLALVVADWGPLLSFDRWTAVGLHHRALSDPGVTHAARVLTDWVWDPTTMRLLTAAAVVVLWLRGARLLAGWLAAATLVGWGLEQLVKSAVGRPRPHWQHPVDSAHFAAFPSGHAMAATIALGLLLWAARRQGVAGAWWAAALAVAVVSALGVGLTRLWLGVHWASDVLGGWLLGVCLVALSVACSGRLALYRDR
ncbi:phosphatase PAP2 family protein [Streptomyces montanisoli]|uniref:Phosphatase PAP2 family protein n=1 Tax=Streptomyces montanisoli TaxID=2798581 RepID=A0A940RZH1_9ACTN|nr:phosphatase PAP2 family protein [Streptomyces montanisoli]MBP0460253.1 phosphatase PAP2 family protein [Streptomyces montanisoli]